MKKTRAHRPGAQASCDGLQASRATRRGRKRRPRNRSKPSRSAAPSGALRSCPDRARTGVCAPDRSSVQSIHVATFECEGSLASLQNGPTNSRQHRRRMRAGSASGP
eukprot:11657553-Alexandrium_andersonii.AAC.1